jgi:TFIIF-interacting CTD phosphatase-like protein
MEGAFAGFSSKNLKRLFPTDTSMVVVIDDRADVWGDVPNLVKVVPCKYPLKLIVVYDASLWS